jgi:hypothetical protein
VSDPFEPDRSETGEPGGGQDGQTRPGDTEEIDALPVLAEGPTVLRAYRLASAPTTYWKSTTLAIPAVQAAAVAAGGFVAGAAVVGLAQRRNRQASAASAPRRVGQGLSRAARERRGASKAGELVQIVGSRSFLVDVHLLGGRD